MFLPLLFSFNYMCFRFTYFDSCHSHSFTVTAGKHCIVELACTLLLMATWVIFSILLSQQRHSEHSRTCLLVLMFESVSSAATLTGSLESCG